MKPDSPYNVSKMQNALPRSSMELLFADCPPITLKKGDALCRAGEVMRDVVWVTSGLVEVSMINQLGQKHVLAFHFPNSIIGETEAFCGEPSNASCVAIKNNTVIRRCNADILLGRLLEHGLVREYFVMCAKKAHVQMRQTGNIALESCTHRVNQCYNNALTHEQIAELVGCSRVQVTRVLNLTKQRKPPAGEP